MGKIKISGKATVKFEPDHCIFHVMVSVTGGTSGDTISKGRYRTEEILRLLKENAGIEPNTVTLDDEESKYNFHREDGYVFKKSMQFSYPADNHITETITSLLENLEDVEYSYSFELSDRKAREEETMAAAIADAKAKAEKIAASLNSKLVGYDEIRYEYTEENPKKVFYYDDLRGFSSHKSLAADLNNPEIEISKSVEIVWITE